MRGIAVHALINSHCDRKDRRHHQQEKLKRIRLILNVEDVRMALIEIVRINMRVLLKMSHRNRFLQSLRLLKNRKKRSGEILI